MQHRNPQTRRTRGGWDEASSLALLGLLGLLLSACARDQPIPVTPTAFLSPLAAQPSPAALPTATMASPLPTASPMPFAALFSPLSTPPPTSTPGPSPTPSGHWSVPVVAANESAWSEFSPLTESPTPMYAWPPRREPSLTSPNGTYAVECDDGLRLYRAADHQLLSESPLQALSFSTWSPCSHYVTWAPDESAVAIQIQEGAGQRRALYIWHVDGSAPRKVVDTPNFGFAAWSPDSQRLAVIRDLGADGRTEIVTVVDSQGRQLSEFQIENRSQTLGIGWLTDDVLVEFSWYASLAYYRVSTGRHLFTWLNDPRSGMPFQQSPTLSPDRRWITLDRGDYPVDQAEYDQGYRVRKRYSLFDLQNDTEIVLADHRDTFLGFLGWSEDSSLLYVISRPAISVSVAAPDTPYGLLAFEPVKRQFHLLFKGAVQVQWGPDRSWAYVVFASRGASNTLGLAGGFWKAGTDTVVGQQPISDQMIYQDPAYDPKPTIQVPLAWSHDGKRAVVAGPEGQIHLFHVAGAIQRLATDLPCPSWRAIRFGWSHDLHRLLVQCSRQVWIADIPG